MMKFDYFQAFTFVSLLNTLQGSLMAVAFSLKSLTEVSVTNVRIKVSTNKLFLKIYGIIIFNLNAIELFL